MADTFKDLTQQAVNDVDLTNALLGKVFDVLTSGGEVGLESGDNFYCWLPVGHPVMPDQFEFMEQGLTGTLRKRTIGDVNDKSGESDSTSSPLMDMIRKDQEAKLGVEMEVKTAETAGKPYVTMPDEKELPKSVVDSIADAIIAKEKAEAEKKAKEEEEKKAKEEEKKAKEDEKKSDEEGDEVSEAAEKANEAAKSANTAANAANVAAGAANAAAGSVSDVKDQAQKAATAAYAAAGAATAAVSGLEQNIEAAVQEAVKNIQPVQEKMSEAEMKQLLGEDTVRMYMQAEDLARLVDFIPDISPRSGEDDLEKIQIRYDEGSFSDAYKFALRYSQVMKSSTSDEDKAKIEELRSLLQVETVIPGIAALGESDKVVLEDSPLVQAYNTKMLAYNAAALQYNNKRIAALTASDPAAVHDWAINAPIYENSKNAAMADWRTRGYKDQYEKITAAISQMEQRDLMLAKEECWKALERSLCTGISSGSDFYFTTLSPASFMRSGAWTRFSFKKTDYNSENIQKTKNYGRHVDTSASTSFLFSSASVNYQHDYENHSQTLDSSFDLTDFEISFEVCQANIVRPWFKPTFINSNYWRFDQGNVITKTQMLSDGVSGGLLPAYTTAVVFIRNVVINFGSESNKKNFLHTYNSNKHSVGAKASSNFLFFNAKASTNVGTASGRIGDEMDMETSIKGNELHIAGTQIIGYCCHRLGVCPNPHPEITEWV